MIDSPKNCPSCNSLLEWSNDQLYCRALDCPAKGSKSVEHFAKTLKIKGLGPSTVEKLDIYHSSEIYDLTLDYITNKLSSERMASKLLDEIERSKQESLNLVLPAFGIPLIGKTATDKLSSIVDNIFEIDENSCKKAGLGPKATESLLSWLKNSFIEYEHLPFDFTFTKKTNNTNGKVICITGKLVSYKTKTEAQSILEQLGYTVKSDLTKDVSILVNESGRETAKTIKAGLSGVYIVTNLKTFIENGE
jgi:DNA ligase (NAD+)